MHGFGIPGVYVSAIGEGAKRRPGLMKRGLEEGSLTQGFDSDLPGEWRRQVDAHQIHILMQQHLIDAASVERNTHLLGQLLGFFLSAAPQCLHREALIFQQRDDDTGREAGAEHAHPGKHGCSGPSGSASAGISSRTPARTPLRLVPQSPAPAADLAALRQSPSPGQGARVRRCDSTPNRRPCRLREPQCCDRCSVRHAGIVSFPETASGTPPGRTRPRSPVEPGFKQRSRRCAGRLRAPRRGRPMAGSSPQNLSLVALPLPSSLSGLRISFFRGPWCGMK